MGSEMCIRDSPYNQTSNLIQFNKVPNEIFTINLNAQAIIPEAFILLGIVGTLLVDLAGEKTASKWAPIICYLSIGSSLVSLALQWTNPVESAFLGSFNSDNLAIAFRAIISLSTLISLLISWRYTEQSGSPIGEFAAIVLSAPLGAMLLCGSTDLISVFISLETLSVASYLLSGYLKSCLLYTSPSPRDLSTSRMPSSA